MSKLMCLVELYAKDFCDLELMTLDFQLNVYILDVSSNVDLSPR